METSKKTLHEQFKDNAENIMMGIFYIVCSTLIITLGICLGNFTIGLFF